MRERCNIFYLLLTCILAACMSDDNVEDSCLFCPPDFSLIDSEPAWSPNGDWIAFSHGDPKPDQSGIYLVTPEGGQIYKWHQGLANAPAWSPDGCWIAFSENGQIWKKKIDGDSLTQLTFEGQNFFPAWSADGQWIAFDNTICGSASTPAPPKSCGILVVHLKSNKVKYLVPGRFPNWKNNVLYIGLYNEIYQFVTMDSSVIKQTSFNDQDPYRISNSYPKLSTSNNKIVFTSQQHKETVGNGFPQIWTMNIDGSHLRQLSNTQGYSCDWSPDGKYIAYTDSRRENGRLWVMDWDGRKKRQLTFEHHF